MCVQELPKEGGVGSNAVVLLKNMKLVTRSTGSVGVNQDNETLSLDMMKDHSRQVRPPLCSFLLSSTTLGSMSDQKPDAKLRMIM